MERGNVFDELRKEILDLTLKPGTELNLNQLSTIFGVSRSPVRDAVKELAGEHLIDIYPQRGTYVSRINLRMADDERFIRLNLELGSIPDFIENVNDDLISEMEDLIEKQEKAFALRDTSLPLFSVEQRGKESSTSSSPVTATITECASFHLCSTP